MKQNMRQTNSSRVTIAEDTKNNSEHTQWFNEI